MKLSLAVFSLVVLAGCAGRASTAPPPSRPEAARVPSTTDFDRAFASLVAHDDAHDWTDASCRDVARGFEAIGSPRRPKRS